jgi:hypothetical protein
MTATIYNKCTYIERGRLKQTTSAIGPWDAALLRDIII